MRPRQIPPPQCSDDRLQPPECHATPKGRRDDKIGAAALFAVRDLGAQDVREATFAHSRSAHYPFALQARRRRHNQHEVAALDAAGFKQQRYVEDDEPRATSALPRDKPEFRPTNHWMDDSLETAQRRRVTEHPLPQALAIDPAGLVAHSGERRFDHRHRGPSRSKQPMDDRIGIE